MTKKDRWILSEYLVARDRVFNFNDSLIYHQQTTPYAELDLIFESAVVEPLKPDRKAGGGDPSRILTIIEVKSVSGEIWAGEVVSRKQTMRLERARWYVELQARRRTKLILATVQARPEGALIRYFEAPFS